jgi:hypothetical protein
MNSRERFRETMRYGAPDRVPYFEEGIRDDVLRAWRRQAPAQVELEAMFRRPPGGDSSGPGAAALAEPMAFRP